MDAETLAMVLAVLMDEADRSGDLRRRVSGRLWRLAEMESGVDPDMRAALSATAGALEARDAARERQGETGAW